MLVTPLIKQAIEESRSEVDRFLRREFPSVGFFAVELNWGAHEITSIYDTNQIEIDLPIGLDMKDLCWGIEPDLMAWLNNDPQVFDWLDNEEILFELGVNEPVKDFRYARPKAMVDSAIMVKFNNKLVFHEHGITLGEIVASLPWQIEHTKAWYKRADDDLLIVISDASFVPEAGSNITFILDYTSFED